MGPLSEDYLLGGKVRLRQPVRGFRASTDAVFLAAACGAKPGQSALDVGSGGGAASLCLHVRVKGLELNGLELDPAYAALSEQNAALNGADWRVYIGDVADPPKALKARSFDHILTNPPFFKPHSPQAPLKARDIGQRESVSLALWLDFCLRRLKPFGALTLIHRTERLAEILGALEGRAGGVRILPLQPRAGRDAPRFVLGAIKESRAALSIAPPLIVHKGAHHEADGDDFTDEAAAILRAGAALPLAFS